MTHEPFDTLVATYALGALDGDERAQFERHLAGGCDVCEETLRESAAALAALARAESSARSRARSSGRWRPSPR